MKTYLYRASNLKATTTFLDFAEVNFWCLQIGFTEVITTSLIPLVINFPEICAFIISFTFTGWTKLRPLSAH